LWESRSDFHRPGSFHSPARRAETQLLFGNEEKLIEGFGGCSPAEGLPRSAVQGECDRIEVVPRVSREISALTAPTTPLRML